MNGNNLHKSSLNKNRQMHQRLDKSIEELPTKVDDFNVKKKM